MKKADDLRLKPLPQATSQIDTDEYQNVEIDTNSHEHREPLVNLRNYGIRSESFYGQTNRLNAPLYRPFASGMQHVYVRKSVARKLKEVNGTLVAYGVCVAVIDGFRPINVQKELWQWMLEQASKRFPKGSPADLETYALRFASNPQNFDVHNSNTWPTHSTGGAVDLTLEEIGTGKRLFMGSIYLDSSALSATRHFDSESHEESASFEEAKRNRRLLFWAMSTAGFVNYPFEWWHFDYVTQASVMNLGMPTGLKAKYGLANRGESPE